jgi:hypothetical protein
MTRTCRWPLLSTRLGWRHSGLLALLAAVVSLSVPPARAEGAADDRGTTHEAVVEATARLRDRAAVRDSLRAELRRYAQIAHALRDSVARADGGQAAAQREREVDETIDELTKSLSEISQELASLDVQVLDNTIRLRDKHGGTVSIALPENLDAKVTRGLGYLSRVILDELPDTVKVALPRELAEARDLEPPTPPDPAARRLTPTPTTPSTAPLARIFGLDALRKKKVIEGDLVKVRDDVIVQPNEVVRGNVVSVMGDALVEGQVDGDVVVVLGDLQLGEGASVGGRVVTVLGRLDRDEGAEVGSVVVVNPGSFLNFDLSDLAAGKGTWVSFVAAQVFLLLVLLLVVVLLVGVPPLRLQTATTVLARRPLECFGLGLLMAVAGHVILAALLGVLVLTVIGIPVALLALLGLALLDLLAVGIACVNLGSWLCRKLGLACRRPWAMAVLGVLVVHVPSFIAALLAWQGGAAPVAAGLFVAGVVLKTAVFLFGLGSLVVSRLGTREAAAADETLEPLPTR